MVTQLQAKNNAKCQVKQEFVGNSADVKPTLTSDLIGSTYYEIDNHAWYIWDGSKWERYTLQVGGYISPAGADLGMNTHDRRLGQKIDTMLNVLQRIELYLSHMSGIDMDIAVSEDDI